MTTKKTPGADTSNMDTNEPRPAIAPPEGAGDTTIAQTIEDVKIKAVDVKLNKDGTARKPRSHKKLPDGGTPGTSAPLGQAGFNEAQVKAAFQGLFSVGALSTNCNVWFLSDPEADCFVPSATLALNQTFPSVATSKWGAISLASLSFLAVFVGKTLLYMQYKQSLKKPAEPIEPKFA